MTLEGAQKHYTQTAEEALHLSMAALEPNSGESFFLDFLFHVDQVLMGFLVYSFRWDWSGVTDVSTKRWQKVHALLARARQAHPTASRFKLCSGGKDHILFDWERQSSSNWIFYSRR